jgi:hypothetical protein
MENHIGLVKIENGRLVAVQYYVSKFERQLGDVINYAGMTYNVGVIGESRNAVVNHLNIFIKNQNRINRKINASTNIQARQMWNEIIADTLNWINN